jgi:hypothetical protein
VPAARRARAEAGAVAYYVRHKPRQPVRRSARDVQTHSGYNLAINAK